jgi:hypothetical protein
VDWDGCASSGLADDDFLGLVAQALTPPTLSLAEVGAAGRAVYRLPRLNTAAASDLSMDCCETCAGITAR